MGTRPFIRRRLGRELAALRKAAGLTADQVSKHADVDGSSITRIENAKLAARVTTIRAILDAYQPAPDRRAAIVELARQANAHTWWHDFAGGTLPKWFEVYVDLEAEASELATWDVQFINGLVQTADYSRALFSGSRPEAKLDDIERQIELRMGRQKRVLNGELSVRMVLDESALLRRYGSKETMQGQLEHLAEVAQLRNVSFQLLPLGTKESVVGSFHLVDFADPEDPPVVYIEHEHGGLYLEKPNQIRQYARSYDRLRAAALSPEETAERVAQLVRGDVGDELRK